MPPKKSYKKMEPDFDLSDVYDEKRDRIYVPAGSSKFNAIAYKGRYPVLFTKVAGTTQPIHKKAIQEVVELQKEDRSSGEPILIAEPQNRYDPNAILVGYKMKKSGNIYHLGYIPAPLAKLLTQIRKEYSMRYTVRIDDMRSNRGKDGSEMTFPCSVKLVLSPDIEEETPPGPQIRTLSIGTGGMTLAQLQRKLSKKRM